MKDLNQLLRFLLENKLDFVLVGGIAGVVHGSAQVTQDLDICLLTKAAAVEELRRILAPLHPKHRMTPQKLSFLTEPRDISAVNNIYLDTDLGPLDILSEIKGVGNFERILASSTLAHVFGLPCKVISLDDLITTKKAMGRIKDKAALVELLAIKKKFGQKQE
jgi:predicted nucleotidyltransferase